MFRMSRRELPRNQVLIGDASQRLAELPEQSVNCVVTSPPYFGLRNYGVKGQIGLEDHVDEWVDELRVVMHGLARVLRADGCVWLNLGDSYARHPKQGTNRKSLFLGPERLALKLIEDGWIVRNKVVWAKSNTMPSSVRDRLACRWEVIYLLTRSEHYYFDLDPIRVPHRSKPSKHRMTTDAPYPPMTAAAPYYAGPLAGNNSGLARLKAQGLVGHPLGANPRDVWELSTSNFRGQHFATFPASLVVRPLLTSPEKVCARCDRPWSRGPIRTRDGLAVMGELRRACQCRAGTRPGLVLDPFFGAGTVGVVAEQYGRDWLGIELNPSFARLATERIAAARQQSPKGERHAA